MRKLASELTIGKARQGRNSMRHMMNSVESQLEIADTVKHLILGTSSFIPRNHTRKLHPGIVSSYDRPNPPPLLFVVICCWCFRKRKEKKALYYPSESNQDNSSDNLNLWQNRSTNICTSCFQPDAQKECQKSINLFHSVRSTSMRRLHLKDVD